MSEETSGQREHLGRIVRATWVDWALEQPDPKPSWLLTWAELDDRQREVNMRIGEAAAAEGAAGMRALVAEILDHYAPKGHTASTIELSWVAHYRQRAGLDAAEPG